MDKAAQLNAKLTEAQALCDAAEKESRQLTAEEQTKLDALEADCLKLKGEIEAEDAARRKMTEQKDRLSSLKTWSDTPRGRITGAETIRVEDSREDLSGVRVPKYVGRRYQGQLRSFKGPDAADAAYACGQWYLAALYGKARARKWCEKNGLAIMDGDNEMLASGDTNNISSGYLVPEILENVIIDLREQYGVFRPDAQIWNMKSDTSIVPRRVAGLTAYFVGDNQQITASDKQWDAVTLVAKKLGVLVRYASELDEDAIINVADDLTSEIAYAFALKEDQCGFTGDGTSTYGGMRGAAVKIANVTSNAGVYSAASGHTGIETVTMSDYESVIGLLPQYADVGQNAAWYVSRYCWAASMVRLIQASGGTRMEETINGVRQFVFMGYPVRISQVLNKTAGAQASKIIALFGDLRKAALFGNRRGITLKVSTERYLEFDQIGIMGTERFDINCHDVGSSTQAGPIVALQTAAS
jgi:HK97 family phage major capsid protein